MGARWHNCKQIICIYALSERVVTVKPSTEQ